MENNDQPHPRSYASYVDQLVAAFERGDLAAAQDIQSRVTKRWNEATWADVLLRTRRRLHLDRE